MKNCGKIEVLFDFTSFGKNIFLCFTGSKQYVIGYAPSTSTGCWGHIAETPDFGHARHIFESEIAKLMDEKRDWTPKWFDDEVKAGRCTRYSGVKFAARRGKLELP